MSIVNLIGVARQAGLAFGCPLQDVCIMIHDHSSDSFWDVICGSGLRWVTFHEGVLLVVECHTPVITISIFVWSY